ncbi:MAG: Mrp/NBP35 family ATP-binding protein [Deltaproteobacteria bacterium]|nr:Mrp/NBP35 family ATP-binding protein [Deltaproteobacteria bacterium]
MGSANEGVKIADKMPNSQADPDQLARESLSKIKNKFIVMSGKGGVGKTSAAVNLSIALANQGHKVGLMDVDLHGPDIPRMLGLEGMLIVTSKGKILPQRFSSNLSAVSIESLMPDKDEAVIWRGPLKHSAIRQFVGEVQWGSLDFLIIDSPPGTGDEPLTIAQLIKDARAIIVTTPQEVALGDVRKSINFCKRVNMEIFGLIENMSGFQCPHCHEMVDLFGTGGGEKTAAITGIPFLGKIPFDSRMVACGDSGTPYQNMHKDTTVSKSFLEVAQKMGEAT